jgi:hypothetical protein
MITLAPVDYMIIAVVSLAVLLRVTGDIRDIRMARSIKSRTKTLAKRTFSPRLTIIMPLTSLESIKPTLEYLRIHDVSHSIVVVINTLTHAKDTSALRYFIRKHGMKRSKVTARKNPDLAGIAGEYAKSGVVVVLPDSVRLNDSFYDGALLPFGDNSLDSIELVPSIRTDKTLHSGIEVLFEAWRRYVRLNGIRRSKAISSGVLPEGLLLRAKFVRKLPKRDLKVASARRPFYSISPQQSNRLTWSTLKVSIGAADYLAVLVIGIVSALLFLSPSSPTFAICVFAALYVVLVWWSLGTADVSLADRISIVLLSPFFFVIALSFVAARIVQRVASALKGLRTVVARIHFRSQATSN